MGKPRPLRHGEMHQYAQQIADQMGFRHHRVAFVAMAEPSLPTVLRDLHQAEHQRIVVVPHLLFDGDLLTQIRGEFDCAASQSPQKNGI
ncbi:MAG: CbiX/SirB N-terminal domain-containing protein [Pirellulales bacterium]